MKHTLHQARMGLFALSLAITVSAHAQQVDWVRSHPVDYLFNPEFPSHRICSNAGGDVFTARMVGGSFNFGQNVLGPVAIERRDADGLVLWSYEIGDTAIVRSIACDDQANVYVSGQFSSNLYLEDDDTLHGSGGNFDERLFLFSLDGNGALRWARDLSLTYPQGTDAEAVDVDHEGQPWYGVSGNNTVVLARVNALGQDVVQHTISNASQLHNFDFDPWDNLWVTGFTSNGTLTFGGLSVPVTNFAMTFVLRMNSVGQGSFAQLLSEIGSNRLDVATDENGNGFVTGGLLVASTFGGLDLNGPNWVHDVFLAKVDSTGDVLWAVESAPDGGPITGDLQRSQSTSVATGPDGRVYLSGVVRGSVDWGNGVVSDAGLITQRNLAVICFDADGTPLWSADGGGPGFTMTQNIMSNTDGIIHFATTCTGEFTMAGFTENSGGDLGVVFGRIADEVMTGVTTSEITQGMSAYPLPTSDVVTIELPPGSTPMMAELLDAAGARVHAITLVPGVNTIHLNGLSDGLYLLRALNSGRVLRLIKD